MTLDDSESELRKTQLAWREAAKQFWDIKLEEPSSEDIAEAVSEKSNAEVGKRWKILWQNSDRMLFGKKRRRSRSGKRSFAISSPKIGLPECRSIGFSRKEPGSLPSP